MIAAPLTQTPIKPGMLVRLRRRLWRVEAFDGRVLTATPVDDFGAPPQDFVLELEQVTPGTLPDPSLAELGRIQLQRLFMQAARLDALHGTAPFLAIQRTAVIPVEYQLVPLVMAMQQDPVRLLIADTTGLGKTVEAGLIMCELIARSRARSILIITPANLREQWREQMRDLFYLGFDIISSDTRRKLERMMPPGADPWTFFERLIVSIDYAKDIKVRNEILKRKWDLVVVDEAHNACAPHNFTGRKADMERYQFLDQLAEKASKHLLLLTATPHNGYTDSYSSLLRMLSPSIVRGEKSELAPIREKAIYHVCQRTRKDVAQWFEEANMPNPFPGREPANKTEVGVDLHRDYLKSLERLDAIMKMVGLHARGHKDANAVEWLRLHLFRRALSSPEALRVSLENRIENLRSEVRELATEVNSDTLFSAVLDKGGTDAESEEEVDRHADLIFFSVEKKIQLKDFQELLNELKKFTPAKDRKLGALRDQVIPELLAKASDLTPARVIIFTRFKDTLNYLERELSKAAEYEVITLHGDLSEAERDRRFEQFGASKGAVLIATDVISEGLNLQSTAAMVVHYDIPWNPNRLEQRVGRVDRFGQRSPLVYVRTVYCRDTTDEDVMALLVRKLERIREDQGFCPPFFVSEETVLNRLVRRAKKRREPAGPTLFDDITEEDEEFFGNAKLIAADGFYGQSHVRIRDVSERLREAHEKFGTPERIRDFIRSGLGFFNSVLRPAKDGTVQLIIENPRLVIPGVGREAKAVLTREDKSKHPDAIVLDVGHPLVRRLISVIREHTFQAGHEGARTAAYHVPGVTKSMLIGQGLLRATSRSTPPALLEEIVVFGIASGTDGEQPLSKGEVVELMEREPSAQHVNRDEALEDLKFLFATDLFTETRQAAKTAALEELRAYRAARKSELLEVSEESSWLEGFDEVEEVGFDLHTLTLIMPEAR